MSTRVYFGRLPRDIRKSDLEDLLAKHGLKKDDYKDINLLEKHGYGFVEFVDKRDAGMVVEKCNGETLLDERIVVEHAKASRRSNRIRVENLSSRTTWQTLKDFMRREAGDVVRADVVGHREGVVEFRRRDDMKYALDRLHKEKLDGRRIEIYEDREGDARHTSRRRSRSASRSRSPPRRSRRRSRSASRSRSPPRDSRGSRPSSRSPRRRSPLRSRSRSPARSPPRSRSARVSRSRSPPRKDRSRSRSRSRSPSPRKYRSRSPMSDGEPARSRTPVSRSRSPTPA